MHFWINKPAGRYYGFTGRRYPATPLPKTSFNRRRYNVDSRQMLTTPLHRFQSLTVTGNSAGPSNVNNCRAMQTTIRPSNNEGENSFPVGSTRRVQPNNIPNNVTTAGNNQLILTNTTPNGTNMSLLFFSDFNDTLLARFNLRRCVCTIFIVSIGFIAAVKFYFRDKGQGIELFLFWGLLPLILFACLYFTLCRRNQRDANQEHHIREEHITEEHIAPVTTPNSLTNETIKPISVVRQNPPPPYHIAILIPPPNLSEEAPPPTYDKVVR
ncbi:uncharacterized protein LOC143359763 isoform X1 [Halictus rubicundus]|uniref:uncharacterized protein LOC143359763 isoform X1 n=2 Tax=Halictus rubicundus TaxID=77578 RepID=UPI0040351765